MSLFRRASDGSGLDVPLATFDASDANRFAVASWSRNDILIFNVFTKNGDIDLWTLSLSGDRTRKVFVSTKHSERNGTFSPDGRGSRIWRGDGKELFFVSPAGTMMAAAFDPMSRISQDEPQPLFATQIRLADNRPYAVARDGQHFLLEVGADQQMVAVMDWRTLLDR